MPNLIIDPYVFACPQPEEGIDEFRDYIESIISWREFREAGWASVYVTTKTYEILAETDSYPLYEHLGNAISRFEIRDVQARDVVNLVNDLLLKLPTIEDHFLIEEILVDDVRCVPSTHLRGRHPLFVEHYYRLIILICLIIQFQDAEKKDQILITRCLDEDRVESEASGKVVAYECSHEIRMPACTFETEGQFPLCNTPNGLYLTVDPVALWSEAKSPEDFNKVIEVQLYQLRYGSGQSAVMQEEGGQPTNEDVSTDKDVIANWTFNQRFFESASGHGFIHQENRIRGMLRACAHTLLKINLRAVHALREGRGAGEKQKMRGSDKAWRRDIDHEYHLHYWETGEGFEFASVGVHSDMNIPE